MNKQQIRDSGLLEKYVLGDVNPAQVKEVEDYLKKYPELIPEVQALEEVIFKMSSENSLSPPPHIKGRLMQTLAEQTGPVAEFSPAYTFWKRSALAALLAATILLIGGIILFQKQQATQKGFVELQESHQALVIACEQQALNQQTKQQIADLVLANATQIVAMEAGNNQVYAYWNPQASESLLHIKSLPTLSEDQVYQLWADIDGEMISVKVLEAAEVQFIPYLADATSLNITIEPSGGSEHPTISNLILSAPVS